MAFVSNNSKNRKNLKAQKLLLEIRREGTNEMSNAELKALTAAIKVLQENIEWEDD